MILVVCDTERLAFAVGVYKRNWEHVLLHVHAPVVAECKRPIPRCVFDGSPEVDDLEAIFEELWDISGGEMAVHARNRRWGRLVDMDLRDGLALSHLVLALAWQAAPER